VNAMELRLFVKVGIRHRKPAARNDKGEQAIAWLNVDGTE